MNVSPLPQFDTRSRSALRLAAHPILWLSDQQVYRAERPFWVDSDGLGRSHGVGFTFESCNRGAAAIGRDVPRADIGHSL